MIEKKLPFLDFDRDLIKGSGLDFFSSVDLGKASGADGISFRVNRDGCLGGN